MTVMYTNVQFFICSRTGVLNFLESNDLFSSTLLTTPIFPRPLLSFSKFDHKKNNFIRVSCTPGWCHPRRFARPISDATVNVTKFDIFCTSSERDNVFVSVFFSSYGAVKYH